MFEREREREIRKQKRKKRTKNSLFDADRVERKIHNQHLFKSRRDRYAKEVQEQHTTTITITTTPCFIIIIPLNITAVYDEDRGIILFLRQ